MSPENTRIAAHPNRIHIVYTNIPHQALCGHTLTEQDEIPLVRDESNKNIIPNLSMRYGLCADCVQPLYTVVTTPAELLFMFTRAIRSRTVLSVSYKTNQGILHTTDVAPLDYGPSRTAQDKTPRLHMWDIRKKHVVSVFPDRVLTYRKLDETFNPADIVTWEPNWHVLRNW